MNRKSPSHANALALSKVAYMGLDCHKNFSRLTARDGQGQIVCRQRLEHADAAALLLQLGQFPSHTPVVLEGSFGWSWISDMLTQAGLSPYLANCRKVDAWRKARGLAKSNRIDADLLSEMWPQQPRWWHVHLPPREVQDQRELLRHRMGLVRTQTAVKNRIHAILVRHGVVPPFSDLFGKAGREFLQQLLAAENTRLRATARIALASDLKVLATLRQELAHVLSLIRLQVKANPAAKRWMSLPGIGWILAHTITAEIGPISRFANGRHLASYSLLSPKACDSGEEDPNAPPLGRRLGKIGCTTLKWAFLEAARGAIQKSPRLREIFNRKTHNGTVQKNKAYVAIAHQLCLIGFACQKHGQDYVENPPPRPGTKPAPKDAAQTVQGQPDGALTRA